MKCCGFVRIGYSDKSQVGEYENSKTTTLKTKNVESRWRGKAKWWGWDENDLSDVNGLWIYDHLWLVVCSDQFFVGTKLKKKQVRKKVYDILL